MHVTCIVSSSDFVVHDPVLSVCLCRCNGPQTHQSVPTSEAAASSSKVGSTSAPDMSPTSSAISFDRVRCQTREERERMLSRHSQTKLNETEMGSLASRSREAR